MNPQQRREVTTRRKCGRERAASSRPRDESAEADAKSRRARPFVPAPPATVRRSAQSSRAVPTSERGALGVAGPARRRSGAVSGAERVRPFPPPGRGRSGRPGAAHGPAAPEAEPVEGAAWPRSGREGWEAARLSGPGALRAAVRRFGRPAPCRPRCG